MNDGNVVVGTGEQLGPYLYRFECSNKFQPGDSGKIIVGKGKLQNVFTCKISEECESPLFMLIARHRINHCNALAVYLPYLLHHIRLSLPIEPIDLQMWDAWEPISSFGEVQMKVAKEVEKLSKTVVSQRLKALKMCGRKIDSEFIEQLFADEEQSVLQSAFLLENDLCWVVQFERENLRAASGYFKLVDTFMVKSGLSNIDVHRHKVYSTTTTPVNLNEEAFKFSRERLVNKNTACHHPFLCELNEDCKGVQRKHNKKGEEINSRWISHTCIRPSHLANMNKQFNNFCTVLQHLFKHNETSAEWK